MFDSASKRLVSGQHALSPTHSTKKRLRKRVLDSSEESSCQNESSQADGADGAESTDDVLDWPLVEIDVRANVDTPSKSIKGMARRGGSTKRFSGTRGSRSSSHTTPTRLAVRRSTRQQPGNESYEGADFDETPALTSGRRVLATERHAARSATSKSSESDDPEAEMRIEQHNNSDGSEELGVAASKAQVMATPKRNSRVAKPKSSKGAVQSESGDNGSPAVDSAGEAGNDDTPQKTPRSAAGSATPKWKAGRRYFRYKEPETPSTSVTRSGRKVRKPQDWWANAQEHLDGSGGVNGSGQKEAKIKYKWGSGEAIVVQDGKRVRLSDFYLQGGDNEVLFGDSGEDKTKSPL
ncbi:hypothetical protein IW150_006296 [Coemansia sp. RSA 2607]|nr:hypothetical protein IW150_006296 [Coemansia sp. RSA 2607]